MEFKRNKKYFSLLKRESETRWVCENPLFLCGDKGLFPVYRANGRQGVLNKNYHELILKSLGDKNGERIKQSNGNGQSRSSTKLQNIL
tara:strand:- start:1203 stop:1466 length:264 start_codon:yes stop_codon:yes gene_type:complete